MLKKNEYLKIIKVRDLQISEYKQNIEELESDIKEKNKKISLLQQQLEDTIHEETKLSTESDDILHRIAQDFGTIISSLDTDQKLSEFASDLVPSILDMRKQINQNLNNKEGLIIQMTNGNHKTFVKLLKYFKITHQLDYFALRSLASSDEKDIKILLQNSFPQNLKGFYFNTSAKYMINICGYIEGLTKCLPRITGEVGLNQFALKNSEFSSIIKAAHNSKRVWVINSKMNKDSPFNFSIHKPYKTTFLGIEG